MSEQPPPDEPREPEESAPAAPDEAAPAEPEADAAPANPPEVESAPTEAEARATEEPVENAPEAESSPPEAEAATTEEPVAEAPAPAEPVAEAPAPVEPVAEAPAPAEPEAHIPAPPEAEVAGDAGDASKVEREPDERPAPPARAADPPATAPGAPGEVGPAASGEAAAEAVAAAVPTPAAGSDDEGEEIAPRVRPEIPGADLEPDIVLDGGEPLTGEGAEDLAEADPAAPLGDVAQADAEEKPIAQAAIDLAAGARYTATGKRKSAVARVIVKPGSGEYLVNGKTLATYFPRPTLQRIIRQPLETVGYEARMDVVVRIHGGGVAAQAGALRHGISRALIEADPNLRTELKRRGFLTRDPRVKERKKAGLKKARKRPQFSKR